MSVIKRKFYFYKCGISQGKYPTVASALSACKNGQIEITPVIIGNGDYTAHLQSIMDTSADGREMIRGIVKKFDIDHTPKVGVVGEIETDLVALAENQWLIHNSHFLLDCRNDVLLYHQGIHAVSSSHFAMYLTSICRQKIELIDALDEDAYRNLRDKKLPLKKLMLRVAMPTNLEMIKSEFSELGGLAGMGGHSMKIEISGNMRKADENRKYLNINAVDIINKYRRLKKEEEYDISGTVEFEGFKPVDIFADRLCVEKPIKLEGIDAKTPDDIAIFESMKDIMIMKTEEIDRIFGSYE